MPSEVYKVSKRYFFSFVKDKALKQFQNKLSTIQPDWYLRKCYVKNNIWNTYKKQHMKDLITEIRRNSSTKRYNSYGENAMLISNRSTSVNDKHNRSA
jgi:hypothetical protein